MTDRTAHSGIELECPQCGAPVIMPQYADMAVCASCGSTLARERRLRAVGDADATTPVGPMAAHGGPTIGTVAPATAPEEQVLRSVQCSQCAGPLSAREGRRILVCRHCGVRVVVKQHGGITRWYFPPRVDRLGAAAAAAGWLREHPEIAKAAREARLVESHLLYAPIWEHRTLLAGWEFGYKLRPQSELVSSPTRALFGGAGREEDARLEVRLVREGVEEAHLKERRFYQAATDFDALGATRPRVTGRELLVPLLAGELEPFATVLEAQGSAAEVADKGRRAALLPLSGAVAPDSHLFTFRESTALLYYPLWLVHFRAGDRACRVVVNGRDGTVNAGVAPASNQRRVALLATQAVLAAMACAILVWLAATRDSGRATMVALAVIVFVAAALSIWRFRMVGEVEYHEPFSG
ncbi:MAG: hypothetical protein JXA87_10170 [Thermoleophilia bacterium]|nr:hypothetical protein [Thermoleophilia bacterium]